MVAGVDWVRPMPLIPIASGFGMSKTLAAAVNLGLADRPAGTLLTARTTMELLESDGERFRNSAVAEEFLVPGKRHYFGDYVKLEKVRAYISISWERVLDALRTNATITLDPKNAAKSVRGRPLREDRTVLLGDAVDIRSHSGRTGEVRRPLRRARQLPGLRTPSPRARRRAAVQGV